MYLIKEKKIEEIKKYRTSFYCKKTGLALSYLSAVTNGNLKCTEITARAILSVYFGIPISDDKMEELLKEYFKEE